MDTMKIKVTRPDGTVIEIEGTAQDIQAIAWCLGLSPQIQFFTAPGAVASGGVDFSHGGTFKVGHGG